MSRVGTKPPPKKTCDLQRKFVLDSAKHGKRKQCHTFSILKFILGSATRDNETVVRHLLKFRKQAMLYLLIGKLFFKIWLFMVKETIL